MRMDRLRQQAPMVMAAVVFLLLTGVGFSWLHRPQLVVVDMMRAIHVPSQMLAHSKISSDEQLKIMSRYSALLPKIIKAYGESHHVTVVSAMVFVSHNGLDVTSTIIEQTLAGLRHDA